MTVGVLYTATGSVYVEQALVSIHSVRRWNPGLQVAVFTDDPTPFRGIADFIEEAPEMSADRTQRMLSRLVCLGRSPFSRTLAIDTDTVILGPLHDLFSCLDGVSVAICHGHQRSQRFEAALSAGKAMPEIPYSFAPVQGGVILYDNIRGKEFVTDVVRLYQEKRFIDDQVSMREVLWKADYRFAFLPPEYNIWQLGALDRWRKGGFREARPMIFHTVTLKENLGPADIDRLLLPYATQAARGGAAPDKRPGSTGESARPRALSALRSRIGRWRMRRRLRKRLKNC